MYEIVKTVNGYTITRMTGTRGRFYVKTRERISAREYCVFNTIKAAAAFCETLPELKSPRLTVF